MCTSNLHTRCDDEIETNSLYDKIIPKVMPFYIHEVCISATTIRAHLRPLLVNKVIQPNFVSPLIPID